MQLLQGIPLIGRATHPEAALEKIDPALKKRMADVGLNAAKSKGATYTDVRIGRYINQFVTTREDKIENVVNTESYGMGIRVIANGSWGFAATHAVWVMNTHQNRGSANAVADRSYARWHFFY